MCIILFLISNNGAFGPGVIPLTLETKTAHDGDYMGYSGVCGHFFSKGELLHVAGAPRGDTYMGKVRDSSSSDAFSYRRFTITETIFTSHSPKQLNQSSSAQLQRRLTKRLRSQNTDNNITQHP